ncbi:Srp72p [Coemansia sp. Benny D115]|nr:Srp72p [Coemansia sp. Benny D115]
MASQTLESFYSEIRDAIAAGNLSAVVDSARSGLKAYPKDAELAKIEIVALIKQDNAAQALEAIGRARGSKLLSVAAIGYEHAYCYFAVGKYDAARAVLGDVKPGPSVDQLRAQIEYKCNKFSECVKIYEKLLASTDRDSPMYSDLQINLSAARAADAQMSRKSSAVSQSDVSDGSSYELIFNEATQILACGRMQEAIALLTKAIEAAKSTLSAEGWSEQEIQAETGPIDAQRAIALQKLGKGSEARAIYSRLLGGKSLDSAARDVLGHNAAILGAPAGNGREIRINAVKRMLQIPGRSSKNLSHFQRALMTFNMAVAQVSQSQYTGARRTLKRMGKSFADVAVANAGVVSAVASLRGGDSARALNELSAIAHTHGAVDGVRAALAAAQVAIELGDAKRAASVLSEWKDKAQSVLLADIASPGRFAHHYFGICLLLDWLSAKEVDGVNSSGNAAVAAAEHLSAECGKVAHPSAALLTAVGDCLVYAGNADGARKFFVEAKKAASEQGVDAAKLASAHMCAVLASESATGGDNIPQLLKGLRRRKQAPAAIPGAPPRFARQFQPRTSGPSKGAATKKSATRSAATVSKRTEKYRARRQRRLLKSPPKGYEPERKPDAERWIPLRQRSYYKPRGRGRKQQQQQQRLRGAAQGGTMEAGSGLGGTGSARIAGAKGIGATAELSDDAKAEGSAPAAPSPVPSAPASASANKSGKGGKGGKGKKGKGKKGSW